MSGQLRYSDDQRDAIVSAVLDDGLSARESAEKASAGELGVPAFHIPVSTAQAIVTDAKNRGRVADNTDRLHQLVHAMLDIAQAGTTKLEQRQREEPSLPRTPPLDDASPSWPATPPSSTTSSPRIPPRSTFPEGLRKTFAKAWSETWQRGTPGTKPPTPNPRPAPRPSQREQLMKELQEVATAPAANPGRHTAT